LAAANEYVCLKLPADRDNPAIESSSRTRSLLLPTKADLAWRFDGCRSQGCKQLSLSSETLLASALGAQGDRVNEELSRPIHLFFMRVAIATIVALLFLNFVDELFNNEGGRHHGWKSRPLIRINSSEAATWFRSIILVLNCATN
jgi:hypothetical protein